MIENIHTWNSYSTSEIRIALIVHYFIYLFCSPDLLGVILHREKRDQSTYLQRDGINQACDLHKSGPSNVDTCQQACDSYSACKSFTISQSQTCVLKKCVSESVMKGTDFNNGDLYYIKGISTLCKYLTKFYRIFWF